jgi:DNA-binding phage protein
MNAGCHQDYLRRAEIALAPGAKPRFETIATIMRALNAGFSVESRVSVRAKNARRVKAT